MCPDAGQGCNMAIKDAEALGYLFRDIQELQLIGSIQLWF
jgi:2-polyprenyl-6-methoxyphenol hydroxylase-like FAD-dependent oxidoreductase